MRKYSLTFAILLFSLWQGAAFAQVDVTIPVTNANQGDVISIPVNVSQIDASDQVIAYQFDVLFDPNVLEATGGTRNGSITPSSWSFLANPNNSQGKLSVGAFDISGTYLTGSGTLVFLNFTVVGNPGTSTSLTLSNFIFNNGNPPVTLHHGQFNVNYADILIQTSPSGLEFQFDGTTYTSPHSFRVSPSSDHDVVLTDPQYDGSDKRYVFDQWNDGNSNVSRTVTAPASGSTTYTAQFDTEVKLDVNVDPAGAGSVSKSPDKQWYELGSSVTLTANANPGYDFSNWTGTVSSSSNPLNINMTGPQTLTAHFTPWPEITITTDPAGQEVLIDGNSYVAPQTRSWQPGTQHTIGVNSPIAVGADERLVYNRWSDGGSQSHTITVPGSNTTYTAFFDRQYKLSVNNNPPSGGTVTVNPNQEWFNVGTSVSLEASANPGYQFVNWSGDASGSANPISITMNSGKSVTANYGEETQITVDTDPTGLKINVDGAEYTAPHTFTWLTNTNHTIATDEYQNDNGSSRYRWDSWSDGKAISHEITANKTTTSYKAFFVRQYHLTTSADPPAGGTVTPAAGWYDEGTSVQVEATANANYQFTGWSGDLSGTTNPDNVTMDAAKTVTAQFTRLRNITVSSDPGGRSIIVDGTTYTAPQTFQWLEGSTHSIGVNGTVQGGAAGVQYVFQNWSDGGSATHNVTVPGSDETFMANFATQYLLTLNTNPTAGGSVSSSPAGPWYNAGTAVQVEATANAGYQFVNWSGDLSGSNNPESLTMDSPKSVTANFGEVVQVTVRTDPAGLDVEVDGSTYTAPHTFTWLVGTQHQISTPEIQNEVNGERKVWTDWDDGGARSHAVTASSGTTSYTAHFKTQYYLTVNSAHDTPTGAGWYDAGTAANFGVTSPADEANGTRYEFTTWSGDYSGADNPASLLMNAPKTVTANWKTQYFLSTAVDPAGAGSINPAPPGQWYDAGEVANFSTTPNAGYQFGGWNGDYTGTGLSGSVTMDRPKSVTAQYGVVHTITVQTIPAGQKFTADGTEYTGSHTFHWVEGSQHDLSVVSPQNGSAGTRYVFTSWSDGGAQSHTYTVGTSDETVTANFKIQYYLTVNSDHDTPAGAGWYDAGTSASFSVNSPADEAGGTRYRFTNWSGDYTGTDNPASITMDGPKTVTANWSVQYLLTVISAHDNPTGSGWYDSGETANFGVTSPADVNNGTRYVFAHWSGDYAGTNPSGSVTMDRAKTVTANWNTEYYLTVNSAYGNPSGEGWYASGATANFSVNSPANQSGGTRYVFDHWSGDYSGSSTSGNVTMDRAKTVTANWTKQYELTTSVDPAGSGTIAKNPDATWYNAGTQVQLTANPGADYGFKEWSGDLSGSSSTKMLTMDAPKNVVARFGRLRNITVRTSPSGLTFTADGRNYYSTQTFNWIEGTTHSLSVASTVSAGSGKRYVWSHWSQGGARSQSYRVPSSDKTLIAYYDTQYYLTTSVSPSNGGSVSPASGWQNAGSVVQLQATPASDYKFVGWSGDVTGSSNPTQVTMNAAKSVTANFELNEINVTVTTDPPGYSVWVDGREYATPKQFSWIIGSWHTIEAAESYDVRSGEQLWWQNWSDGGSRRHTIRVSRSRTSYIAHLRRKFYLTLRSDHGAVSGEGWYWEGDNATIKATSPVSDGRSTRYVFTRWSGDYTGTQTTAQVSMTGPKTVIANWRTEYYLDLSSGITNGNAAFQVVEAEFGKIKAEMSVYSDPQASNGAYVASPVRWSGEVDLPFHVPQEGDYWIWGRVYGLSDEEDSFWFLMDDSVDTLTWDISARWGEWYWSDLRDRHAGRLSFHLAAGDHVLRIFTREKNSRLDKIVIVNTSTFTPQGIEGSRELSYFAANPFGSGWYAAGETAEFGIDNSVIVDSSNRYQFAGWGADFTGTANPAKIVMDAPKVVMALWRLEHKVTTSVLPEGAGTLTVSIPGPWYAHGTSVEFTANPAGDYVFDHWSGDAAGTSSSVTIIIDEPKSVTANFIMPNRAPSAQRVTISPQNATEKTPLSLSYQFSDPDGDSENGTVILWFRNNIRVPGMDNQRSVPVDSLHVGDVWQAIVIPSDGQNVGARAFSNPVVILPVVSRNTAFFSWSGSDTTVQFESGGLVLHATIRKSKPSGPGSAGIQTTEELPPMFSVVQIPGSERFFFENTIRSYWLLFSTLRNFSIDLELSYTDSLLREAGIYREDNLILGWSENLGDDWYYESGAQVDTANNVIRLQGLQHLSLWAIGVQPFSRFFPVELAMFEAETGEMGEIRLNWMTKSETDNLGFEVQRSKDGERFERIGFVRGRGTVNEPQTYTFVDQVQSAGLYYYRLKQIDLSGTFSYSEVLEVTVDPPRRFQLLQNYPNPFNGETTMRFSVPQNLTGQPLQVVIYNVRGQKIYEKTLSVDEAGIQSLVWNGRDQMGNSVGTGIYFLQVRSGHRVLGMRKMLFVK